MNLPFVLILTLFWVSAQTELTPFPVPEATRAHISTVLNQFAIANHVPCFVAGFQVYSTGPNGTAPKKEEKWTWAKPGGFANVENSVNCTTETMLRVASVSKAIGSGLVARMVEQGKLHWDDDVNKYVPETVFPKKTWNGTTVTITLRQLITHQSGLRHTTNRDLLHDYGLHITNTTQTIRFFAKDPLLSAPGTAFYYSNNGWQLLGAVVEAVEGRSYHLVLNEYMRQIGMKHAQNDDRNEVIAHRGSQYQVHKEANGTFHLRPAPMTDLLRPFPHWPAGGVLSNIDDLLTYGDRMLRSYNRWPLAFLKPETVQTLWNYKPTVGVGHETVSFDGQHYPNVQHLYAMGWERIDFPVETKNPKLSHLEAIFHLGGTGGVNAILIIFPKMNVVFGAIANTGNVGGLLQALGTSVYHSIATAK